MTGGSRTRAASRSWPATCVRCIRRSRPVSTSAATSSGRCWTTSSGPRGTPSALTWSTSTSPPDGGRPSRRTTGTGSWSRPSV